MLKLEDLMMQENFRLRLEAGTAASLERPIAGAHSIEIDDPVRWLEPEWILLTTGLRLWDDPESQRRLVSDAARGGITAIGFGQHHHDAIPAAMLEEAESCGFPVFSVPRDVPLRLITTFVSSALADSRMLVMQRSEAIQAFLIDGLSQPKPVEAIMERLASVLNARALFFRPDGQRDVTGGEGPTDKIWDAIRGHEPGLHQIEVDGADVLFGSVTADHYVHGWLAIVLGRLTLSQHLVRQIVRNAQHLLAVPLQARVVAAEQERLEREALLWSLVDPPARPEERRSDEVKAAAFGLDFVDQVWVGAARMRPAHTTWPNSWIAGIEAGVRAASTPYLIGRRNDLLILIAQLSEPSLGTWLAGALKDVGAGVGRGLRGASEVPQGFRDALLALAHVERLSSSGARLCRFEDLGLAERLIGGRSLSDLAPDMQAALDSLRERQGLYETLATYMTSGLDVSATAETMHLHPNSVRYRLKRIEETLGRPVGTLPTLVDLYLAIIADQQSALTGPADSGRTDTLGERSTD